MPTKLKAKIVGVRTFDNNWAILSCEHGGRTFRATGTLLHEPDTLKGVICSLEGEWENHPRYGQGFKLICLSPDGSEMFFFLTRIVKVGEKPAQAMVEMFSDDELTSIMETPERHKELLKVKGIGEGRLGKITESWCKYRHVKLLSDFLTPHGLTPNLVMRVYSHFEDRAVEIIKHNPYQLTRVAGIGFKKADDVALRLGMEPHDPFRLAAGIEYVMASMADDGGNTLVHHVRLAGEGLTVGFDRCGIVGEVIMVMVMSMLMGMLFFRHVIPLLAVLIGKASEYVCVHSDLSRSRAVVRQEVCQ